MSLGDISFIAAFIVLPLVIVVLSVVALRTLNRRERRPPARFGVESPVQSTQELPTLEPDSQRDWAASVRPTRGPAAHEQLSANALTQSFKVPSYRGRTKGVVRRMSLQPRQASRTEPPEPSTERDEPQA